MNNNRSKEDRSGRCSESKKDAVLDSLRASRSVTSCRSWKRNEQPYRGWHSYCYWNAFFLLRSIRIVMRQKQVVCGAAKAPHQTVALGDIAFASSVALHSLVLRHTGTWGIHKVLRMQSCCKQTCRIHYSCKKRYVQRSTLLPKSKFSSAHAVFCACDLHQLTLSHDAIPLKEFKRCYVPLSKVMTRIVWVLSQMKAGQLRQLMMVFGYGTCDLPSNPKLIQDCQK